MIKILVAYVLLALGVTTLLLEWRHATPETKKNVIKILQWALGVTVLTSALVVTIVQLF